MLFYDTSKNSSPNKRQLQSLKQANIPEVGVVLEVLGPNQDQDRKSNPGGHSVTQSVERLAIDCHGIEGDRHRGLTRASTGREAPLYKRSRAIIVNRRQLFAVSPHECVLLSQRLGVEVTPQLLGANIVIGREDGAPFLPFEHPGQYLFRPSSGYCDPTTDAALGYPDPLRPAKGCSLTGKALAKAYGDPSLTKQFVAHAEHHRGILCSVEYPVKRPIFIERGQKVFSAFPWAVVIDPSQSRFSNQRLEFYIFMVFEILAATGDSVPVGFLQSGVSSA